ncbi:MAG: extracellular solute-binding protein [Clostridiales Family XIII bacterium]|jgi:raffinose/stachyose/melibiose transport system substrate-binding protein|nr:extracellular solute-binding protein [Clostridiales Family XIII bacterium]
MKFYKGIAILLALVLPVAALSACADTGGRKGETKSPDAVSEESGTDDYTFTAYFGNEDDGIAIAETLSAYEEETGVKVNAVLDEGSERSVRRQLRSDEPPALYVLPGDIDTGQFAEEGYVFDMAAEADIAGVDGSGFPWSVAGFGLLCDKRLLTELAAGVNEVRYVSDMRNAGYEEWVVFTAALDAYIKNGTAANYTLNGNTYALPAKKGEFTSKLNGVYAVAGADPASITKRLNDVSFAGQDREQIAEAGADAVEVQTSLSAYASALDELTSKLAGRFAAGIRGTDFLNEEKYSLQNATEIFAADKAAFYPVDSEELDGLARLNADKAENTIMLPLKTNRPEMANRLLMRSTNLMYVNADAPDEEKAAALAFIRWFALRSLTTGSAAEMSMREFRQRGEARDFPAETERVEKFNETLYEDESFRLLLEDSVWDDVKRAQLAELLALIWNDV